MRVRSCNISLALCGPMRSDAVPCGFVRENGGRRWYGRRGPGTVARRRRAITRRFDTSDTLSVEEAPAPFASLSITCVADLDVTFALTQRTCAFPQSRNARLLMSGGAGGTNRYRTSMPSRSSSNKARPAETSTPCELRTCSAARHACPLSKTFIKFAGREQNRDMRQSPSATCGTAVQWGAC